MSFPVPRRLLYLGAVLSILAPAVFLGLQRTRVYASAPAATSTTVGSAVVSSKYGPISIVVSGGNVSTISLSISVGKLFYTFSLPARDFTQNATSATLDTHSDLKSYGTIHITWTKHTVRVPATKAGCGVKATPAHNETVLINSRGTASLNLPCLSALTLNIGAAVRYPAAPRPLPGVGSYQGIIGSFSFTIANTSSLSLYIHKSPSASQKVDLSGYASHTYTSDTSKAPLQTVAQSFHTGVPPERVSIQSDLSTGTLTFANGPKMLRGSLVQMTPVGNAIPNTGTKATACTKATKGGGASRTEKLSGTLNVHLCAISGTFPVSPTGSFASLFSSSLTVQAPKPLKIVKLVPADKATGVATSLPTIMVTFSNEMSTQNTSALLQGGSDFQSLSNPTLDAGKKVMTFKLTRALQPNTNYTLNLFAFDLSQQSVSSKTTFTTGT